MTRTLSAISMPRARALALASGRLPVEARRFPPPTHLFGRRVAIHACAARGTRPEVVAVAWLSGAVMLDWETGEALRTLGDVSDEQAAQLAAGGEWGNGTGAWLWVLRGVVMIPPVHCPDAQRLWTLPTAIAGEVWARFDAAQVAAIPSTTTENRSATP